MARHCKVKRWERNSRQEWVKTADAAGRKQQNENSTNNVCCFILDEVFFLEL